MTHLALCLTTRSEARITQRQRHTGQKRHALRLTARSEARNLTQACHALRLTAQVRSNDSSCFTSNSEVRSKEIYIYSLFQGRVLSDYTKLISKVFKLYTR
jgi:hypothetical protein